MATITQLQNNIRLLTAEKVKIETDLNKEKENIKVLTADNLKIAAELNKEKENVSLLTAEKVKIETDLNKEKENIKVLTADNLKIAAELNKEKKISAQNKTELAKLQIEKNSLAEKISQLQTALSDSNRLKESAVLEERNKLNIQIDSQKKRIVEAEENIKVLNTENLKLVTKLNIEKETGSQNKIELTKLQQEKNSLSEKISQFQTELSESNQAKVVLLSERNELHIKVQELSRRIIELENDNKRLQAEVESYGESQDLTQEGFTTFISDTMRDLENKMSSCSADEDKKFVVKEMEIEAKVAIEKKGNKGVYVFPTAEKLQGIDPAKLQTIKFMIKSSPKIT